jgi:hypothetical protein
MANNNQTQQHFNIDISKVDDMACSCGNKTFFHSARLKFVSGFMMPTGTDTGVEQKQYICSNPACGLMYPGAMHPAEIKKYSRNPKAARFDWRLFFIAGLQMLQTTITVNQEGELVEKPAGGSDA